MTIWEECGVSIEEYGRAFNEALEEAWDRATKEKIYFIDTGEERMIRRIINIKSGD